MHNKAWPLFLLCFLPSLQIVRTYKVGKMVVFKRIAQVKIQDNIANFEGYLIKSSGIEWYYSFNLLPKGSIEKRQNYKKQGVQTSHDCHLGSQMMWTNQMLAYSLRGT